MSKGSYTVVRNRRGKDRRYHAMLLVDPNGRSLCGEGLTSMVIATTRDAVDCEDCAAMIVDMIRESRKRRGAR